LIYLENVIVNAITFADSQIPKEDIDWLFPPNVDKQSKRLFANSFILVFSPTKL